MANLREEANNYTTPQKTLNITELAKVPVDIELIDDEFMGKDFDTGEPKLVRQKVFVQGDNQYKVPGSVIQQLHIFLEENPEMKFFKVKSSGTGKDTRYNVIPIMN